MRRSSLRLSRWSAVYLAALALAGASAASVVAAAPGTVQVRQSGSVFQPGVLTVAAGTRVVFVNDDTLAHNVYARSAGQSFNLGMVPPGGTSEQLFVQAGQFDIRCAVHPRMRLAVTVTP